jgi:gamma-glutamylcyclotransferase (GGCT)/AIG2-like uncharacterized protein YtfP
MTHKPYIGNAPAGSLFVYGTLIDESRQQSLLGRVCAAVPAILHGYAKHQGKWPYIMAQNDAQVEGWVLLDLTVDDLAQLDEYEATTPQWVEDKERTLYKRDKIEVMDVDGTAHICWVYFPLLPAWEQEWLN